MIHIYARVNVDSKEIAANSISFDPSKISSPATQADAKAMIENLIARSCNILFQPPIEQLIKETPKGQIYEELGGRIREIAQRVENGEYPSVRIETNAFNKKSLTIILSE